MQYEITQIISYLVTAETPEEALSIWNRIPKTIPASYENHGVELLDERVEING
jgi:hypothetical protein